MSVKIRYFLYGFLFGLCFPLFAIIIQINISDLPFNLRSISLAHSKNALLYMIDSAPLFLGLFALLGGVSKAKVNSLVDEFKLLADDLKVSNEKFHNNSDEIFSQLLNSSDAIQNLTQKLLTSNEALSNHIAQNKIKASTLLNSTNTLLLSITEIVKLNKALKVYNDKTVKEISHFSTLADQLSNNSKKIESIGKEINLLSINSSIEAHKYGEIGMGFKTIANQVKTLSESIENLNSETWDISESIISQIDKIHEYIDNQNSDLKSILEVISDIENNTSESKNNLDSINTDLEHSIEIQSAQKTQFRQISKEINRLSQEKANMIENLKQISNSNSNLISKISSL